MQERHTVLVLGAGASSPYGFPTGPTLVDEICDDFFAHVCAERPGETGIQPRQQARNLCQRLRDSRRLSIDSFLEGEGAKDLRDIGKAAIARILLPYENRETLVHPTDPSDDWYRQFLDWLISPTDPRQPRHRVSVITYNYDRSLEKVLHLCLTSLHGLADSEVATFMKAVPIVHIHGRFGKLPWEDGPEKPLEYGLERERIPEAVTIAVDGIRIIFESDIAESPSLSQAHELLRTATEVLFMGFGYDETNLRRLNLQACCPKDVILAGTCHGLTKTESRRVLSLLRTHCPNAVTYAFWTYLRDYSPSRNLDFMRNTQWFD